MAFRGDINALILGALEVKPLHGYEIVRRIREAGGGGKLSEGQIYPYLHKLEEDHFVTAEWQTDTGAAPRRVYQITPSGVVELDHQRALWKKFVAGINTLMAAKTAKREADLA